MLRRLFFLLVIQFGTTCWAYEAPPPRQVDEQRAGELGLRKIVGKHLRLYTDLPTSDAIDSLPVVFDAAVPLWAKYFNVDVAKLRDWKMQGYLIRDREKFSALGLLPRERPDFPNGFSSGLELWWVEQKSDYFSRHLMLHEGTHGFMYTQLGDVGPGWYMEGMAELMGTHRWQDGKLSLGVMPSSREQVPYWGRIKLVRDAYQEKKTLSVPVLLALDKRRMFTTEEYAWCWALCEFMNSHPKWQEKFRELPKWVANGRFNKRFRYEFRKEWPDVLAQWQVFVATLDYGYDAQRMVVKQRKTSSVKKLETLEVDADRGWQSTGWLLRKGKAYELTARGRYEIFDGQATGEASWPCEPGGVTLEYREGQPLGMLLGAWRISRKTGPIFSEPFAIGLSRQLQPQEDAVLYLRVNDSPASLADNRGTLSASIRPISSIEQVIDVAD